MISVLKDLLPEDVTSDKRKRDTLLFKEIERLLWFRQNHCIQSFAPNAEDPTVFDICRMLKVPVKE